MAHNQRNFSEVTYYNTASFSRCLWHLSLKHTYTEFFLSKEKTWNFLDTELNQKVGWGGSFLPCVYL